MPLDPEMFLVQAQRLAGTAENEADYRSAVSRAYYACHLVARDALFGVDAGGGRRRRIGRSSTPSPILPACVRMRGCCGG